MKPNRAVIYFERQSQIEPGDWYAVGRDVNGLTVWVSVSGSQAFTRQQIRDNKAGY